MTDDEILEKLRELTRGQFSALQLILGLRVADFLPDHNEPTARCVQLLGFWRGQGHDMAVLEAALAKVLDSSPRTVAAKSDLPMDLITLLAEEYPDVRDARALWQRAGGAASEVENVSRPRDLWQRLWVRSTQGASVRPEALLQAALNDLPSNPVLLRHLAGLKVT